MVIIVNTGLEYLARHCNGSTDGSFNCLALDDGTTVEAAGTTALTSEITTGGMARVVATCTYEADYRSVWYYLWTCTVAKTAEGVGVFNSVTPAGSKMLLCHLFATIKNVDAGGTLAVTVKLTFST